MVNYLRDTQSCIESQTSKAIGLPSSDALKVNKWFKTHSFHLEIALSLYAVITLPGEYHGRSSYWFGVVEAAFIRVVSIAEILLAKNLDLVNDVVNSYFGGC